VLSDAIEQQSLPQSDQADLRQRARKIWATNRVGTPYLRGAATQRPGREVDRRTRRLTRPALLLAFDTLKWCRSHSEPRNMLATWATTNGLPVRSVSKPPSKSQRLCIFVCGQATGYFP